MPFVSLGAFLKIFCVTYRVFSGEWVTETHKKAEELALRFDKKARYFLDIIFQGGAHMVNHHEKVNAHNAFKSEKAAELRESKCFSVMPHHILIYYRWGGNECSGASQGVPRRVHAPH